MLSHRRLHTRLPAAVLWVLTATLLFSGIVVWSVPTVSATPLTLTPTADAYVSSSSPNSNYGSAGRLEADKSPTKHIYLKFNVAGVDGTVDSATLRLYVVNSSTGSGGDVAKTSDTSWNEGSLTWNNRPAIDGAILDGSGPVKRSNWVEFDVTGAVTGNGLVSLAIQSESVDGVDYVSSEASSHRPELVVTYSAQEPEPSDGIQLPGSFEVEDYREGGQGIGYFDTSSGNSGKEYRQDDVDIQTCTDPTSGSPCYNIGWIREGEWLAYDVSVATAGDYAVSLRAATPYSGRSLSLEVDGTQVGPSISIPNTGGFQSWATTSPITVHLEAGNHPLRLATNTSSFNLNWVKVDAVDSGGGGGNEVILVGAGDISTCFNDTDEATAKLLDDIEGTVFTLGDNVNPDGSAEEYANCYDPTWGRHKHRTRPAVGNHDYVTPGATGYFDYFGAAAGDPSKGWYSYDLGDWHIVVLNSNCSKSGGCDADDPQAVWLATDLAAHPNNCTLAYWHHPRWSSGDDHGNDPNMQAFWEIAYDAGVELILNGHEHLYERFAPQNPSGESDSAKGIRQITAGTGGVKLDGLGTLQPNSEVLNTTTHGVLKLTLGDGIYSWEFVPVAGGSFTDSGTDTCH